MTEGIPQDYEAQNDARTLSDAHAVRKDKKRHGKAMKHLKKMGKGSSHAVEAHEHETGHPAEGSPAEEAHESAAEAKAEGD